MAVKWQQNHFYSDRSIFTYLLFARLVCYLLYKRKKLAHFVDLVISTRTFFFFKKSQTINIVRPR